MTTRTRRFIVGLTVLVVAMAAVWFSMDRIGGLAFRRGLRARQEWRLAEALTYFGWARRLQRSSIPATLELGLCEQLRGDFLASQKHFEVLLKQQIDDPSTRSRLHNAIGVNHYSFNEPDTAIASHLQALDMARQAANRRLEAEALIDLSRAFYHSKGKFYEALAHLEQAHAIAKEISDERLQAAALRNLGVIYWWFKGELDRPLAEFYLPALEMYRRQNDQRGAATMLTLIALVFNNKGDIYQFLRYQNESVEIQERIGDQAGLADSYMTLGILYNGTGNYRKARDFFSKGLAIAERTGYRLAQNDLNALLADVQLNLGDYDEALKLYDPSFKHKDKDSVLSNYVLQYIAHCYQLKGDYAQALALYERALQVHQRAGLPDVRFRSNTLLRAAECSIGLSDWQRASQFYAQARQAAEKGEVHSEGEIRPALVAAAIAQHESRHEEALKHLRQALDVEERIFASAKTNLLIPPHRRTYEMLFGFLLDYAIANTNSKVTQLAGELAFSFLENMRYRSLRNFVVQTRERNTATAPANERQRYLEQRMKSLSEELGTSGSTATRGLLRKTYNDYEELTLKTQLQQPQLRAIAAAKPVALSEFQSALHANSVLIEFLFVHERVFAVAVSKNSVRVVQLPVTTNSLAAKVKLFRSLVFTSSSGEKTWGPVAQSLRDNLIEPLETAGILTDINTIGLVPYGFLHDLPFAALARSENGKVKVLIEDYALFQTPSATFLHKSQARSAEAKLTSTVTFGRNQSTDANLPGLAFAAEEASLVAQMTGGQSFLNEKATETDLKRMARDYNYLHLSTHGVAESEMPLLSRLLLEPTNADDGRLTVREIFELGLRTELVTLSACETGRSFSSGGYDFSEQDRIGLIEAFLHANSRSVLASLLPVSDKPTTEFMKRFYAELRGNQPKVEALASTQRAMLRAEIGSAASPGQTTQPRHWAPFILVGDPR